MTFRCVVKGGTVPIWPTVLIQVSQHPRRSHGTQLRASRFRRPEGTKEVEDHGFFHENHGKIMGKPWKFTVNSWKIIGIWWIMPWKFIENKRTLVKLDGKPWGQNPVCFSSMSDVGRNPLTTKVWIPILLFGRSRAWFVTQNMVVVVESGTIILWLVGSSVLKLCVGYVNSSS